MASNIFLEKLIARRDLTREETRQAFDRIMSGRVHDAAIGAFLAALAAKGETVDEIIGAAEAMRARVTPIRCDAGCIDTCGTGGDGISTFNVSTTAAIIAAAAGATVAKHGNLSHTRISGSAEALTALGVNIDASPETVERCLREIRIGFLFARNLHPAMKHAAAARQALGVRTIINLLGPLTNPAGARRQVIGVPKPELTERLAQALKQLGAVHVLVVHGMDGLCDLTVTTETLIAELNASGSGITTHRLRPEEVGLPRAKLSDLVVDSPQASADAVRRICAGGRGPQRDHALLNASAALLVAGHVEDLKHGLTLAGAAIDDGRAQQTLDRLIELTNT